MDNGQRKGSKKVSLAGVDNRRGQITAVFGIAMDVR